MTLNMFLGQPCCICIKEDYFDLKGSETDVTGILHSCQIKRNEYQEQLNKQSCQSFSVHIQALLVDFS